MWKLNVKKKLKKKKNFKIKFSDWIKTDKTKFERPWVIICETILKCWSHVGIKFRFVISVNLNLIQNEWKLTN